MAGTIKETIRSRLRNFVVDPEVDRKIDEIPNRLSESGYDAWGFNPEFAKWTLSVVKLIYEKWFRVETYGIENVPKGRVLLAANHSGQLPLDGVMIAAALALYAKPPRATRALIEKWFLVFPEGVGGSGKLIWKRYQLQKFGAGFMRLAVRTGTPVVPVAVVGAEETYPSLLNVGFIARLAEFPYFPVTPTFPFFGPLGFIPFPTKIRIYFDEPILFEGDPDEPDEKVGEKVQIVRSAISRMIQLGLETRQGLFR
jgi:1-acyl-sn-glycerol-3-phosphate acyltransferase